MQPVSWSLFPRVASKLGLSASLVAPESTIRRRLSSNVRFSEAESERVVRLTRVYAEAVELFGGDEAAALLWLNTPADYLPDQPAISPLHLSGMDSGARLIESHIRRTAHGIF
jgi:putative toxin-antitoxin system antitoxin component (TIGR02293 family)